MRKWLILTSYFACSFLGGAVWATLIPVPQEGTKYYNINEAELTLYSYTFGAISIILAQVSIWMVAKSLYWTFHFIWIVTLVGTWIRVIAGRNFYISFAGQIIVALSNMPVLTACSSVATLWFPQEQVILATSIAAASNFVGIGYSFLFMVYYPNIEIALWIQAGLASFFFLFNLVVGKKEEKVSLSLDFKGELMMALRNKYLMIIVANISIVLGVNYSITSIIGILLEQQGFGESSTGLMGFIITVSGLIGGILATYLAEVRKSTKSSLIVFMILTILSSIAFSALLHIEYANYIMSGLFGASITGSLPLGISACVQYMSEIHDSIPTNLIYLFAQIISCVLTYPIQYFYPITNQSGLWVGSLLILISYVWLLLFTRKIGKDFGKDNLLNKNERDSKGKADTHEISLRLEGKKKGKKIKSDQMEEFR